MEFTSWDSGLRSDELAHFGTKGMKWGQRRFQNEDGSLTALGRERYGSDGHRSARGVKRDLNKLDREHSNAVARRDEYQSWVTRKKAKAEKRAARRGEKVQYSDRIKKYEAKANEYGRLAKSNERMTERIISSARKKGYSVKSKDTMRAVNKGRNTALSILGTAAGVGLGVLTGTSVYTMTGEMAPGKKYKVRNDGLGTRTHDSSRRLAYAAPHRNRKKGR